MDHIPFDGCTVSYTHLDVYKRQAVGTGVGVGAAVGVGVGVPLRANCRCAQRALSTVPFLGMAPTEIDVYKRQPLPSPCGTWTFESCRSSTTKGRITNLCVERLCDRPQFARVKACLLYTSRCV